MKRFILIVICMFLVETCLKPVSTCFATSVNGVEVTEFQKDDSQGIYVTFFSDYNPGTDTFVFNEAGGTGSTDGQLDTSSLFSDSDIEIQISIPTLGSTSMTVTAYGKTHNATTWGEIYSKTYTAATATNNDDKWPIAERPDAFKIGVSVDTPGTDSITITGDFITERKK